MEIKKTAERLFNYDILRILAAYLIVMLHLSVQYINKAPSSVDEYLQWQQAIKFSALSRVGVPAFIMLSGAFLLNPMKEVTIKKIFTKYLPKLFLIFIIWSAFYSLGEQGFWNIIFTDGISNSFSTIDWNEFWQYFAQGHYHMWYLYMLAGLYLLTPLLKHITEHATTAELAYFTLLCVIVTSVTKLNEELWNLELLDTVFQKLSLSFFFGYLGYFIGGYLISKYTPGRIFSAIVFVLGFFAFKITYEQTWLLNPMFGFDKPNLVFFSNYSPTVFLMSFAVFLVFAKLPNFSFLPKIINLLFSRLARYTLVVYLVHPFMIVQCRHLGVLQANTSAWSLPTNAFIVFLASLAVSFVLMEAYKLVFRIARC